MTRVSDAQCLAAYAMAQEPGVSLYEQATQFAVIDASLPVSDRVVWTGPLSSLDAAKTAYQIAYMRPILTAALNVC